MLGTFAQITGWEIHVSCNRKKEEPSVTKTKGKIRTLLIISMLPSAFPPVFSCWGLIDVACVCVQLTPHSRVLTVCTPNSRKARAANLLVSYSSVSILFFSTGYAGSSILTILDVADVIPSPPSFKGSHVMRWGL